MKMKHRKGEIKQTKRKEMQKSLRKGQWTPEERIVDEWQLANCLVVSGPGVKMNVAVENFTPRLTASQFQQRRVLAAVLTESPPWRLEKLMNLHKHVSVAHAPPNRSVRGHRATCHRTFVSCVVLSSESYSIANRRSWRKAFCMNLIYICAIPAQSLLQAREVKLAQSLWHKDRKINSNA